jgi:hypothetical protein
MPVTASRSAQKIVHCFRVEEMFGWRLLNRLRIIPDLPVQKIRELGRFVKNQRLSPFDELGARAPMEIGVAIYHVMTGPLRMEMDAFVGDLEEDGTTSNLAFFHVPLVITHAALP